MNRRRPRRPLATTITGAVALGLVGAGTVLLPRSAGADQTASPAAVRLVQQSVVAPGESPVSVIDPPENSDGSFDGRWQLAAADTADGPVAALQGRPFLLQLEGASARWEGCNLHESRVTTNGNEIQFGSLRSTMRGCSSDVDADFGAALSAVRSAAVDTAGRLVMEGGGFRLVFARVGPSPAPPVEGPRWLLDTLIEGETATGPHVFTLRLADGRLEGSAPCGAIGGTYRISEGMLTAAPDVEGTCPGDDTSLTTLLRLLQGPSRMTTSDGVLTISHGTQGFQGRQETDPALPVTNVPAPA